MLLNIHFHQTDGQHKAEGCTVIVRPARVTQASLFKLYLIYIVCVSKRCPKSFRMLVQGKRKKSAFADAA